MKTKSLQSLSLQKTAIAQLTSQQVKGGIPTTKESNITCGGICAETAIIVCGFE